MSENSSISSASLGGGGAAEAHHVLLDSEGHLDTSDHMRINIGVGSPGHIRSHLGKYRSRVI